MQQGFTLIELTVAIVALAFLTAWMLPRVWDTQRKARIGNLQHLRGTMHATATVVHAAMLAQGGRPDTVPCPGGGGTADNRLEGRGTFCTEAGLVQTMHGYPASVRPGDALPGILGAAGVGTVFRASDEQLRAQGYAVGVSGPRTTVSRADAPDPAACGFTYTEPLVARTAASMSTATVHGC